MVALWNICALWFLLLSIFLFSSPNLSRRRLDVCHTSTHGVVFVRIYDAGLKRVACGSLKYRTQKVAKNRQLGNIAQICRAISSQIRHYRQSETNLLSCNYMSSTCPHNTVNFGPLTAEIGSGVWGTPANFNCFRVLAALLHGI